MNSEFSRIVTPIRQSAPYRENMAKRDPLVKGQRAKNKGRITVTLSFPRALSSLSLTRWRIVSGESSQEKDPRRAAQLAASCESAILSELDESR